MPPTSFHSLVSIYLNKLNQNSIAWIIGKSAKKTIYFLGWITLLPIGIIGHFIGFRRLNVHTDRIGHLAAEIDCFEKERRLNLLQPKRFWFVLAPRERVANQHLLQYWKGTVQIITSPILCTLLQVLTLKWFMIHDVSSYILAFDRSAHYYKVNVLWGKRPPLLQLTNADNLDLNILLTKLGLPPNSWFVCFHCREAGFSSVDENIHSHRNADIDNYKFAMEYVVQNGGWCIRMGDPSMKPLSASDKVIDYAHSIYRSDKADVLLCAGCNYFVGTSSGLWILSSIFGKSCALSNMIPISTLGYSPLDISIPKLLAHKESGRVLKFSKIFGTEIANYRISKQYQDAGIAVIENTPAEILGLVKEVHNKNTTTTNTLDDRFTKLMRDGDYGYGSGGQTSKSFQETHINLF